MRTLHRYARQEALWALIVLASADLVTGVFKPLIEIPPKSYELDGFVDVTTASTAATSDVLDVGTAGTPNGYANDINAKVAARTALTIPAGFSNAKKTIGITRTQVGADASLACAIGLSYIQQGVCSDEGQYGTLDSGVAGT